ncbi:15466_t:CDS:2 [Dentiscutata erythropus]|uniref:15466_t:CDS:1 n=1 Tax=Dentiscutata erythropus TaxID=1348616 RepID=A0A9N9I3R7_9GLOM|nr:15466_t:CDS:2 [Dentiscutata erythropus]
MNARQELPTLGRRMEFLHQPVKQKYRTTHNLGKTLRGLKWKSPTKETTTNNNLYKCLFDKMKSHYKQFYNIRCLEPKRKKDAYKSIKNQGNQKCLKLMEVSSEPIHPVLFRLYNNSYLYQSTRQNGVTNDELNCQRDMEIMYKEKYQNPSPTHIQKQTNTKLLQLEIRTTGFSNKYINLILKELECLYELSVESNTQDFSSLVFFSFEISDRYTIYTIQNCTSTQQRNSISEPQVEDLHPEDIIRSKPFLKEL